MSEAYGRNLYSDATAKGPVPSDAPRIMLMLGAFEFSIDTVSYETLSRDASWRWSEQQRIGKQDLLQFTGKTGRTVKLDGAAHQSFRNGLSGIEELYLLADQAKPQQLVTSHGDVLGYWVVRDFNDNITSFFPGGTPRHKTFSVTIQHYADDLDNP